MSDDSKSVRVDTGAGGPDSYEARYMDGGRSLARDRKMMPWWFHTVMAVAVLAAVVPGVAAGKLAVLLLLPVMFALWLLLTFVRVSVTPENVHIQYGVFGPKIAIRDIVSATAQDYDWKKYGGWGIRIGRDGSVAYSVAGGNGRGVLIEYRNSGGRTKRAFVSCDQADVIAMAIDAARMRAGSATRVDPSEASAAEELEIDSARDGPTRATRDDSAT